MQRTKIIAISGSLRRDSFNTTVLRTLAERFAGEADIELLNLKDVPMYDQDADTETPPPAVAALRAAIRGADGVVIASPEYNYGVPGMLKNALDWASRPYGQSSFIGKPVLTITSSPAVTGGVRAQAQLHETLAAIGARLMYRPQSVLTSVHTKIQDGRLADADTLAFLDQGVRDLLAEIERNREAVAEAA